MTSRVSKEELRSFLPDYLKMSGRSTSKAFSCISPDHEDLHPSMSYDKKSNRVHCFSCGKTYDLLDVIGIDYSLTGFKEQIEKAGELLGVEVIDVTTSDTSPNKSDSNKSKTNTSKSLESASNGLKMDNKKDDDFTPKFKQWNNNLKEISGYLASRGISVELANKYLLGYEKNYPIYDELNEETNQLSQTSWRVLTIPTSKGSYVVRNLDDKATKKNRYRKHGKNSIFNYKAIDRATTPIFIVEGELDALSILEAGYCGVALGSTSNYRKFLELIDIKKPAQPLIIALDNDKDGQKTANTLLTELQKRGIESTISNPYGMSKDANEALITDRETFIKELKEASKIDEVLREAEKEEYLKNSASNHINEFMNGIADSVSTPPISTGFKNLDHILDGGLYSGLYFVGAISSLGKTTLLLQLSDQIAQQGKDVLIYSLEMSRAELMAKSISRLTFLESRKQNFQPLAKTTRGILDGKRYIDYSDLEKKCITTSIHNYKEYASHLFIHEGLGNIGVNKIDEVIKKHIEITGNKPVVIIDYLQQLAPFNEKWTDKQNTDKNVLTLKQISRENKIPIIAISSFNRESYKGKNSNHGKVSKADFKESGSIEYSSDILIGLELGSAGSSGYDEEEEFKKYPRNVKLRILKNRNAEAYETDYLQFYKTYNYMEEVSRSDFMKNYE